MPIKRIQVVKDDPFIRPTAEVALKRSGFDVCPVGDGARLLQSLGRTLFVLDFVNWLMPKNPLTLGEPVRASAGTTGREAL